MSNSFTVALEEGVVVGWAQPEGTPRPGLGPASSLGQANLRAES